MRCLYLTLPDMLEPWFVDVREAVADRVELDLYDPEQSFAEQVAGARAIVDLGGSVSTRAMLDEAAAAGVELIQVHGTGLDHVDVDYMLSIGLRVAHCSGVHSAPALAEHALCLLLALAKHLPESRANLDRGVLSKPVSDELAGKSLLLVGLGASGRELAPRARALGLRLSAVDVVEVDAATLEELGVEHYGGPENLDYFLPEADFVSLHVPLIDATRALIDARRLALMPNTAVLINVARGAIVDEDALIDALTSGGIAGAGLDTFEHEPLPGDHPLRRLPNVILTPHTAGVSYGTSRRRAAATADNLVRLEAGTPLRDELFAAP